MRVGRTFPGRRSVIWVSAEVILKLIPKATWAALPIVITKIILEIISPVNKNSRWSASLSQRSLISVPPPRTRHSEGLHSRSCAACSTALLLCWSLCRWPAPPDSFFYCASDQRCQCHRGIRLPCQSMSHHRTQLYDINTVYNHSQTKERELTPWDTYNACRRCRRLSNLHICLLISSPSFSHLAANHHRRECQGCLWLSVGL